MINIHKDLLFSTPLYISKRTFRIQFIENKKYFKGNVLDMGCGESPFRKYFNNGDYTGTDVKDGLNVDIIAPAHKQPFPNSSFDTILCTEVLEHIPEPIEVLLECHRLLKQNGILYITVPMTWYLHYEPYDYYRYTKYGIQYLTEKAGFQVIKIDRLGGFTYYLTLRSCEYFHKVIFFFFLPFKKIGISTSILNKIVTWILIPYQLLCLVIIKMFDRFSPRDARGWSVIARKIA